MAIIDFLAQPINITGASGDPANGSVGAKAGSDGAGFQSSGNIGTAETYCPIVYAGNFYVTVNLIDSSAKIQIYKSADAGATWSPLDSSNAPVRGDLQPSGGVSFDGDHTLTVAWNTADVVTGAPITLRDFDLSTETWGSDYGGGSATVHVVNSMFRRSDSSLIVLTDRYMADAFDPFGLSAQVFSGGGWSTSDLDTGLDSSLAGAPFSACVLDSTDRLHIFSQYSALTNIGIPAGSYYVQLNSDNSVSGLQDFGTSLGLNESLPSNPIIIEGTTIAIGVPEAGESYMTVFYGSPLSAPSFSEVPSPGIDPSFDPSTLNLSNVSLAYESATGILYALYATNTLDLSDVRLVLCQTSTALPGTWTSELVYDLTSNPIPPPFVGPLADFVAVGITIIGGHLIAVGCGNSLLFGSTESGNWEVVQGSALFGLAGFAEPGAGFGNIFAYLVSAVRR